MKKIIHRHSVHRKFSKQSDSYKKLPFISNFFIWGGKIFWTVVVGGIIALLSQGPDAIRHIPEIPNAIIETVRNTLNSYNIDKGLTGVWRSEHNDKTFQERYAPITLEIVSEGGNISGSLYSRDIKKWTIYDMALVDGRRKGNILDLTIYDFIYGKYTELAKLKVKYQEDTDTITDHTPALVDVNLRVQTIRQKGVVLPRIFSLAKVMK